MRLSSGYEDRPFRIEIVPLIDVMFLMLVSFIYGTLSMTLYRGLRVNLPVGRGLTERMETVVISIAQDNSLSVEGKPVTIEEAVRRAAERGAAGGKPVLVSGDRYADLGVAVELLSRLRNASVESVSFQVREEEKR
jgi:biopolymer transport protein ExbD